MVSINKKQSYCEGMYETGNPIMVHERNYTQLHRSHTVTSTVDYGATTLRIYSVWNNP